MSPHFLNQLKQNKMKGKGMLLAAMALAAMSDVDGQNDRGHYIDIDTKETLQERELRLKAAYEKQMKAKGLKEFRYGTYKVWALNQKTADKKAVKLGYIPF